MKLETKKSLFIIVPLLLVWLGMGVVDWGLRFSWFQWQDALLYSPPPAKSGPFPASLVVANAAYSGGDLTSLMGDAGEATTFEQQRPEGVFYTDSHGYQNKTPLDDYYPYVVVGDSFMNSGVPITNTFSAMLSALSGAPVYNHAFPAKGPFMGLVRYLYGTRFKEPTPKAVIWGLLERDLSGQVFAGMVYQIFIEENPQHAEKKPVSGFRWPSLMPKALSTSLPNTSLIAQLARKYWNRVKYALFHEVPTSVVVSQPIGDTSMLFFENSFKAMRWTKPERDIEKIAWSISYLKERLDQQGIPLLILLIPDKAQVYSDAIPDAVREGPKPLYHDFLYDLERTLISSNIPVVNLLGPFQGLARQGEKIYWKDDTHWNPKGVRAAVEQTWDFLQASEPTATESIQP